MEKLGRFIFHSALLSFLTSVIISLLNFFSIITAPEEFEINSFADFFVYFLYVFLLFGLYKENLFIQFLYFLFSLINVFTLSIIIKSYLISHPYYVYFMSLEVGLSSISGLLISISLSYYLIKKTKSKLSARS